MPRAHSLAREGLIAGIIGATVVAVWFLLVDTIAGHPLYTPKLLGAGLFSILGDTTRDSAAAHIIGYTVFHYLAFILGGTVVSFVVHKAETEPSVLVVFTLLFIIFELGWYGLVATLAETQFGALAWYQVGVANVLAAIAMGLYMWKTHPALKEEFTHALGGNE
jgi:hypothetical protein